VHIPIWPGSSTQFQETISKQNRGPSTDQFADFMESITREIARDHVEAYKQLMRELVSTDRGFLLHCSAGKDRTGFGAAIILTLLGVDHDTVMHDYLVSNESSALFERMRTRMIQNLKEQGMSGNIDDEIIKVMSGVRAEYLLGAFEEIDTHYGGIAGYLEEVGISAADQKHLTERLLA
jgi:protein-tyrosine phosphatase